MQHEPISQNQLTQQLLTLGVTPGDVLLVHCAFSTVKPVEGGPEGLIAVLQGALGPEGTLVMPSSSATRPFFSTPSALTKNAMKPGRVSPHQPDATPIIKIMPEIGD